MCLLAMNYATLLSILLMDESDGTAIRETACINQPQLPARAKYNNQIGMIYIVNL